MSGALASDLVRQIVPTGVLRACINFGNTVLAARGPTGAPQGVSFDIAVALAAHLGVPLETVTVETAGDSVAAIAAGQVDLGFFALDPQRATQLRFGPAYVLIEGAYVVRQYSPVTAMEQVDRAGLRVQVARGTAYDLHLTRALKAATIVRSATSQAVVDDFLSTDGDVAAGVRQQLLADMARLPGLRLLPGSFMTIRQAVGIPIDRSDAALAKVHRFVEACKADGFVDRALARHGVDGATVAPAVAPEP
jgi:polar amino acid transport system substrate-binding protein